VAVDDLWYKKGSDGKRVPSERHGRGRRYRVRYNNDRGEPKQRLFERKAEAERFDVDTRSAVNRGQYIDPNAGKVLLRDYGAEWLDARVVDPSTREFNERLLRLHTYPVLGDLELRVLAQRPSVIQSWLRGLQQNLAANYVGSILTNLSTVLSAAVDDGLIMRNPCRLRSVNAPKAEARKVRPWSVEQVTALRDGLPQDRYAGTVDLGWGTGMRQGEVFGLAVDDIDWPRRVVHVQRQVKIIGTTLVFAPPKGDKDRDVPVASATLLRLSAHLQQFPAVEVSLPWKEVGGRAVVARLMFTNRRAAAIVRHHFNRDTWKKGLEAAGIAPTRDHGFHMLRHTYASTMLASGVDIRALSEYLGHADPGFTLRRYAHLMPVAEERARAAVEAALQSVPDLFRAVQ